MMMTSRSLLNVAVVGCILLAMRAQADVTNNALSVGYGTSEALTNRVGPAGAVAAIQVNATATGNYQYKDANGNTIAQGSGVMTNVTWLTTNDMNALSDLYVVDFNGCIDFGQYTGSTGINRINATWKQNHTVTFTNIAITNGVTQNCNYGTYTSGGRTAISGSQAYMALGTINNHMSPGEYCHDKIDPLVDSDQVVTYQAYSISPTSDIEYVSAFGVVFCGKTGNTDYNPRMTVRFFNPADGSNYLARITYKTDAFLGESNCRVFFGVKLGGGCRIYKVYFTGANNYNQSGNPAFDDMSFQIVHTPPRGPVIMLQ